MRWTAKQRWARRAARAARSSWWMRPFAKGVGAAIDAASADRVMEASRAEAALFANLSMGAGDMGEEVAALRARLRELHAKARGGEARAVSGAALHALGESELPSLAREPWAPWAPSLRDCRRRLRRLLSDLAHGRPLGGSGQDRLAEAGAYLDRLREAGAPGVGWPRAKDAALRERSELSEAVGEGESGSGPRRL